MEDKGREGRHERYGEEERKGWIGECRNDRERKGRAERRMERLTKARESS